jgi:hypothetical protein
MSRCDGTSSSVGLPLGSGFSTPTLRPPSAGMYFDTGSARLNLPSSKSIIADTDVMGLLIE